MGKVVAVVSGKGGVGKSTISAGLGRAISECGKRVLLVDCDAGLRCLDKLTGITEKLVYDISDAVYGRCTVNEAIYEVEEYEGLYVLPAAADSFMGENLVTKEQLTPFINSLKNFYDYIILDSPAGIGTGFLCAVDPAEAFLVVCNSDPVSAASANKVKSILSKMGKNDIRLIINRFNQEYFKKLKAMNDLDSVIDAASIRLLGLVPEDPSLISEFLKGGKVKSKSQTMMAFRRIASRIQGITVPFALN